MKKTTGNKWRLGIFVSISIALFIGAIYLIGVRQQLFSNTFHLSAIFKDINGLQVGNNVRFSGISIGIIEDIQQITDSTVRVDMMVDVEAKKFIKTNAKAIIGSDGLMGNKIVLIIPGMACEKEISNNATLETSRSVSIDDILIKIKVTADNAANLTGDMAAIMKSVRDGKGTLGKLVMDSTLANNVDDALVNIKQGTGGFKQNMDAASHNFLLRRFLKKKEKEQAEKTKKAKN